VERKHFFYRYLTIALGLILLAVLLALWIAPQLGQLPANYAIEMVYLGSEKFRQSASEDWQTIVHTLRRAEVTLTNLGRTAIVQGNLHVIGASGEVIFEVSGLYGVDRRTRANVPRYGDTERNGQYLFPPHVEPGACTLWDLMFIGPRSVTFDHAERLNGLRVYVFNFTATALDETEGYSYLPDVPERYLARTDGQGRLWVEAVSGVVVDYEEQGESYFVDQTTGESVAKFIEWNNLFSPETKASQWQTARASHLRILLLEVWLPAALALGGLLWLAVGLGRLWARKS
jgi:hypothetical protein